MIKKAIAHVTCGIITCTLIVFSYSANNYKGDNSSLLSSQPIINTAGITKEGIEETGSFESATVSSTKSTGSISTESSAVSMTTSSVTSTYEDKTPSITHRTLESSVQINIHNFQQDTNSGEIDDSRYMSNEMINISSGKLKTIKAGVTYKEIFSQLGDSANFGKTQYRVYTVDNEKILSFKFDNINDVCKKSGSELLSSAVSYQYTGEEINSGTYAIVLSTDSLFASSPGNEIFDKKAFYINIYPTTEIIFQDGRPATKDDIKEMQPIIVYNYCTLESYPPQVVSTKIVIMN